MKPAKNRIFFGGGEGEAALRFLSKASLPCPTRRQKEAITIFYSLFPKQSAASRNNLQTGKGPWAGEGPPDKGTYRTRAQRGHPLPTGGPSAFKGWGRSGKGSGRPGRWGLAPVSEVELLMSLETASLECAWGHWGDRRPPQPYAAAGPVVRGGPLCGPAGPAPTGLGAHSGPGDTQSENPQDGGSRVLQAPLPLFPPFTCKQRKKTKHSQL